MKFKSEYKVKHLHFTIKTASGSPKKGIFMKLDVEHYLYIFDPLIKRKKITLIGLNMMKI